MTDQSYLIKYPRTPHIVGSRLQHGDDDVKTIPLADLKNRVLVIEEKIDGANSGIFFDGEDLKIQSRGHVLLGGPRERQFNLLKSWATTHQDALYYILENRYIMYGEWMFAKHTIFYDMLPHYFLEFDIFDRETKTFLSTDRRHEMLKGSPVKSVPVIHRGCMDTIEQLQALVVRSLFKSERWKESLAEVVTKIGLDIQTVENQTDMSDLAEGLYIKWEEDGIIKVTQPKKDEGRYKFVRKDFIQHLTESDEHWMDRPQVPNQLAIGIDIFA